MGQGQEPSLQGPSVVHALAGDRVSVADFNRNAMKIINDGEPRFVRRVIAGKYGTPARERLFGEKRADRCPLVDLGRNKFDDHFARLRP